MTTIKIKVRIPGAETEEGQKRIAKAMKDRDQVDYESAMLLKRIVEELRYDLMFDFPDDENLAETLMDEACDLVKKRAELDNEFLRASAGLPPR